MDPLDIASDQEQQEQHTVSTDAPPAHPAASAAQVYPSDEYLELVASMHNVHVSSLNQAPQNLVRSLDAAAKIIQQGDSMRQTDLEAVRRFFREVLPNALDKVLNDDHLLRSVPDEAPFAVCERVCVVAALMLRYRACQQLVDLDQLFEVDQDLVWLVHCLRLTFDTSTAMHEWYGETRLPHWAEQAEEDYAVPMRRPWQNDISYEDEEESEDVAECDEHYVWVSHFINLFGKHGGFDAVQQVLSCPATVHLPLLAELTSMLKKAAAAGEQDDVLFVESSMHMVQQATLPVLEHLLELVEGANEERLTDKGQDRPYHHLSRMLQNIYGLFTAPPESYDIVSEAHKRVSAVQQRFVIKMLESSSFNKVLSGARECRLLFERANALDTDFDADAAGSHFEEVVKWMEEHEIIQRMLRANLHQRQFVHEVCLMLVMLTQRGYLKDEHLNQLWAVTEQEGTYETVKGNVYDMLAEMTKHCSQDQLDMLFKKFELNHNRSLLDNRKLLDLLHRLATSDTGGKMANKIVHLAVCLTLQSDVPPELALSSALLDIVAAYRKAGLEDFTGALAKMCVVNYLSKQQNQVPSLKLLGGLVRLQANNKQREEFVDVYLCKLNLTTVLVDNLCNLTGVARKLRQQNPSAELPVEGCWSYIQIVHEYIALLRQLAMASANFFEGHFALKLWRCLVADPVTAQEQHDGVAFFRQGIVGTSGSNSSNSTPFLERPTLKQLLLEHMVHMDASTITPLLFACFIESFRQVNIGEGALVDLEHDLESLHINRLQGLDYLWRLHNTNMFEWVVKQARAYLALVYHIADTNAQASRYKISFVQDVCEHLAHSIDGLEYGENVSAAVRTIERVLLTTKECSDEVEGLARVLTMPPVPAHSCSWHGTPVTVELQGSAGSSSNGRWRIASHSNEYMGALRAKVAEHLNCSPKQVRLFYTGQEYKGDSQTVAQSGIRSSRHIIMAQVSPQENAYTRMPAEYQKEWETQSLTCILSCHEDMYGGLFKLTENDAVLSKLSSDKGAMSQLRSLAWNLLQMLPTSPELPGELQKLLLGPKPKEQLHMKLLGSRDGSCVAGSAALHPYHMLYALQALCALLFPATDDPCLRLPPPDMDEQMGDAEQASTASHDQAITGAAGSTAASRAALLDAFLSSGCLSVVFAAVDAAAGACRDLDLLRALSHLVVVLLHNVLAATCQPLPPREATSASESAPLAAAAALADSKMSEADGSCSEQGSDVAQAGSTAPTPPPDSPSMEGTSTTPTPRATPAGVASEAVAAPAASPGNAQQQQQPRQQQQQRKQDRQHRPPSASPAPPPAAVLNLPTLQLIQRMLLRLALDTSMLWHVPSAQPLPDDDCNTDVLVVKEALNLLQVLQVRAPELLGHLLAGGSTGGGAAAAGSPAAGDASASSMAAGSAAALMVSQLLLNVHYAVVRCLAYELLGTLCMHIPQWRLWLFQQLLAMRPAASAAPGASCEYYQLFTALVDSMTSGVDVAQQEYTLAEQLLVDEVRALQQPQQQQQQQAQQGGGDAPDVQLTGRLRLVLALVQVLDRRSVGGASEGGLIRLLLQQYLFPEALLRCDARAGRLDLATAGSALEARCSSGACRKAAQDLVAELMRGSAGNLEEGVALLVALHYDHHDVPEGQEIAAPNAVRGQGSFCGLKNAGATCYMNSVFQQLFMQPRIRELVLGAADVGPAERADSVFGQLQGAFAHMALSKHPYHIPVGFWNAFKDYDGTPLDVREHQDAYEFFTRLQDTVDQHLLSTGQTPAIGAVMGGRFAQQVICRGHDFRSEREEDFYQISVDVRNMGSLEKSLETYVQGELMEGDNAYLCEELGKRVPALKRACIKALPHTLAIHLKRFEFDFHSQTRYKLRDRFEFPAEINMFRFTADGLAAEEAAAAATAAANGAGASSNGALQSVSSDAAAQLSAQQHPGYMYDLKGVVVHSGSAFTGHYYSYIKERRSLAADGSTSEGHWYCFDDKSVRPWHLRNLESDCFGGRASQDSDSRIRPSKQEYDRPYSAYMLFYERRDAAALDVAAGAAAMPTADVAPAGAAGSATQQQQQQQQQQGQGGAAAISIDTQQQQQQQVTPRGGPAASTSTAAPASAPAAPFSPPYGMPLSLYQEVVSSNLSYMHRLHVFDSDYFKFVRQVVENKCDVEQSSRKSRRKEQPPAASNSQGSSQGHHTASHMSCDAGAAAAAGPAGTGNAAGVADASGPHAMELASPGPSSRRGHDQERVAVALTRLATLFLFQVHLQAHGSLRTDAGMWKEALMNLMEPAANPASQACMVEFVRQLHEHPEWLKAFLINSSVQDVRAFAMDILGWALHLVAKRSNLPQVLMAGQEPSPLTALLMQVVRQLTELLHQCSDSSHVGSLSELVHVVLDYAKAGPMHAAFLCSRTSALQAAAEAAVHHVSALQTHAEEDTMADLKLLYWLVHELMRGATNLPTLLMELARASRRSSSGGSGSSGAAPEAAAAASDACWTVPAAAFKVLSSQTSAQFVQGLALPACLACEECIALAQLLVSDNWLTSFQLTAALQECLNLHPRDLSKLIQPIVRILAHEDAAQQTRAKQFVSPLESVANASPPLNVQSLGLVYWLILNEGQSGNGQFVMYRRLVASQLLGQLIVAVPAVGEVASDHISKLNPQVRLVWDQIAARLMENSSPYINDPVLLAAMQAVFRLTGGAA